MPLPTGTWELNVNGQELELVIRSVQEGVIIGTLSGRALSGFWDESAQTITFAVPDVGEARRPDPPIDPAIFKGYLFRTPPAAPPGRDITATLTGFVQASSNFGGFLNPNFRRNVFGWFAQISEIQ
jgi:hypothetical protein